MRDEERLKAAGGAQEAENGRAVSAFSLTPSSFPSLIPHPSSLIPYFVWAVAAAFVLGFVSLVMVAPAARAHGHSLSAFFLYEMFGRVCHQIPERAFQLEGYPLAVCARCTGIYFGFAGLVLFYPLVRSLKLTHAPERKWLLWAAVPAALDFTLGFFDVWENTHWSRALSGALLGAVAALYVVPGLVDLGCMIGARRPDRKSVV
jgi:uncharacterized membrane protein